MKKIFLLPLLMISTLLGGFEMINQDILEPDQAFQVEAKKEDGRIKTKLTLGDKIYVYDDQLKYSIVKPKKISLDKEIKRPKPEIFHETRVFRNKPVEVDIPLSLIASKIGDAKTFTLEVAYQGCSEAGLCYQPLKKTFDFTLTDTDLKEAAATVTKNTNKAEEQAASDTPPAQPAGKQAQQNLSEEDRIVNTLKGGSIWTILGLFFGFGLLLSLTPCIFPMIPILSSIIVSQSGEGKAKMSATRGLFLSVVYVLAMAIAYTIAGVFAGLFGANIQTALQNPWVLSLFALVFVALALSMFGYYEIQLPQSLQSKLTKTSDSAQSKGGLAGVAVMGFLSALIVGPCVAPALAGALVYIGQTGDALLGGAALFVMSLGMGVPLLIVGAGAGKFMPKPGGWMTLVSQIFGVVMLGIAIWMLDRIIPGWASLFLWGLLFIGSAIYMGVFEPVKEGVRNEYKLIKLLAYLLLVVGTLEIVGAFSGATNPLDPLEKFRAQPVAAATTSTMQKADFKIVKNIDELDDAIQKSDKPVLLDFSAAWCSSCKELEHITFKDPEVLKLMSQFTLLRADVTDNTPADKTMLKRYNLFGPPGLIFYDKTGNELKPLKTIGYKPPKEFIPILEKALGQ